MMEFLPSFETAGMIEYSCSLGLSVKVTAKPLDVYSVVSRNDTFDLLTLMSALQGVFNPHQWV